MARKKSKVKVIKIDSRLVGSNTGIYPRAYGKDKMFGAIVAAGKSGISDKVLNTMFHRGTTDSTDVLYKGDYVETAKGILSRALDKVGHKFKLVFKNGMNYAVPRKARS